MLKKPLKRYLKEEIKNMLKGLAFFAKSSSNRIQFETDLKFSKNGKEIKESVSHRILDLRKDIEGDREKVKKLAESRGLPTTIVDADDEEKVETYSTRALESANDLKKMSVIRELQRDLNEIKTLMYSIQAEESFIEELDRVIRNVEPQRSFDLTYEELVRFGF